MITRASVDFPQPDSPTMPSVSPRLTVKLTSSTAFTAATCFWKMIPRVTGKCFFTLSTSSRSRLIAPSATSGDAASTLSDSSSFVSSSRKHA